MLRALVLSLLLFPFITSAQIAVIELDDKKVPEPQIRDTAVEIWNSAQPGYGSLPKESREMLYWTNYARRSPVKFWREVITPVLTAFPVLNKAEAKSLESDMSTAEPLPMFILNPVLTNTAQLHATDIGGKRAALSHTSTNGADFGVNEPSRHQVLRQREHFPE